MKPIIGIVEWPYNDIDNDLIYEVANKVVEKVLQHGGMPIGIFPTQIVDFQNTRLRDIEKLSCDEKHDLNDILKMCDAIIKPGATKIYDHERYIYEYAYEQNIPYIGICAGMQIMAGYNNELKNVKNETNTEHHTNEEYAHSIKIVKDSMLYDILKEEEIMVNSRHRYHIDNSGIHNINAYSLDDIIEGIENKDKLFHLGLQWHPENLDDINTDKIFDEFIHKAKVKRFT